MSINGVDWIEFVDDEELVRKESSTLLTIQREFPEIEYLKLRRLKNGALSQEFGPVEGITPEQRERIGNIIIAVVNSEEVEIR